MDAKESGVEYGMARHLLFAIWCGLFMAFFEMLVLAVRMNTSDFSGADYSQEVVWMAPFMGVLAFTALALLTSPLLRLPRTVPVGRIVLVGFLTLIIYHEVRFAYGGLHRAAVAVLALGVSMQVSRLLTLRARGFWRFIRLSALAMVVLSVALSLRVHLGASIKESRMIGAHEAREGAPNILLLILDTVRAKNLSLYGYERLTTPNLDSLANDGVVFDRAYVPAPWTLPTHSSLFTGDLHREMSLNWWSTLDESEITLAEVLHENGYATGGFMANLYFGTEHFGLNDGFARWEDHPISLSMLVSNLRLVRQTVEKLREWRGDHTKLVRRPAERINDAFFDWLDDVDHRPFFGFLNYIDAHDPYKAPAPFDTLFADPGDRYWLRDTSDEYLPGEAEEMMAFYDGAIAYEDLQIRRLFEGLEARGALENTIIVITSDHGEEFGEHGVFIHSYSLYIPSLHVPLIVWAPNSEVARGTRVSDPVRVRDLGATVLDLAGVNAPEFPGTSLEPLIYGGSSQGPVPIYSETGAKGWQLPDRYPIGKGAMKSVVLGDYHYILNGDGSEELYDLVVDPNETTDLASDSPESLVGVFQNIIERVLADEVVDLPDSVSPGPFVSSGQNSGD